MDIYIHVCVYTQASICSNVNITHSINDRKKKATIADSISVLVNMGSS